SDTGYDSNSSFSSSSPNFTTAITRTNKYKPGRAHVAVVNYSSATNYMYNLADAGVSPGSGYVIRDAQNYFEPILSGVYLGGSVSLPLTLTNVSVIYGETNHIVNSHTPSTFNVFVIDSEEGELENGETEFPFVSRNLVANSGAEL